MTCVPHVSVRPCSLHLLLSRRRQCVVFVLRPHLIHSDPGAPRQSNSTTLKRLGDTFSRQDYYKCCQVAVPSKVLLCIFGLFCVVFSSYSCDKCSVVDLRGTQITNCTSSCCEGFLAATAKLVMMAHDYYSLGCTCTFCRSLIKL